MTLKMRIWRATVERLFRRIDSLIELKRTRESFRRPVIRQSGPEHIKYYEKGRCTTISCHLVSGRSDVGLVISRRSPLKWLDTGQLLTPEESDDVFQNVFEYLRKSKVRWKCDDGTPG